MRLIITKVNFLWTDNTQGTFDFLASSLAALAANALRPKKPDS